MKKVTSRKKKRNEITIILEVREENYQIAQNEIKKTIRRMNRLLEGGLSFKIIIG